LKTDEQDNADDRDDQSGDISERPHADKRDDDGRDELDRRHARQRHVVDSEIEGAVHQRQGEPERDDQHPCAPIAVDQNAPRAPPDRKDRGGRRDPQPGDSQHAHMSEEQNGEGRAEIVEHRADHEERMRRHAIDQSGL
jgi:hypothetical protein